MSFPGKDFLNEEAQYDIPACYELPSRAGRLRIRIFFGPPGSGSVSQRYGSGSFYPQAKIVRKTLISTVLQLLNDFLSLKNDVNVPSKSIKKKDRG
jgi:hypothetical protein